ncbi:MAG: PAS domain-containing sensor histidine kinase [Gammaproteobacteria bacterium]|nr:PAS domain-containing sensor histidine kinase [Gammaproteobacteria bacterium]
MPDTQSMLRSEFPELVEQSANSANNIKADHLQEAFEQFTRMSESFVHSYQDLEDQVEDLASRLSSEVAKKKQQLKEKEQVASRLQGLLSILPSGVVVLDGYGRVQDCNRVAIDILGRPLLGEPWLAIINRCFSPRFDDGYEISLKDGRRIHIETRALETEPGQLIVLTDLTETRKLQDQVNQDKRLSSMGRMMASLAHQIRTPLASATLYAESLTRDGLPIDKRQQFGDKLVNCLGHLERHINDMLQFAKSGGLKRSMVNSETFDSQLIEHLQNLYPNLEVVKQNYYPHNHKTNNHNSNNNSLNNNSRDNSLNNNSPKNKYLNVNCDAIKSGLANLIENAYQACNQSEKNSVELKIESNNKKWIVSVTDSGCGMTEKALEKIFDPFYTTKSGGTGLGLAVVHGVVKAHDGKINVKSKPNQGTTVKIEIPYSVAIEKGRSPASNFGSEK